MSSDGEEGSVESFDEYDDGDVTADINVSDEEESASDHSKNEKDENEYRKPAPNLPTHKSLAKSIQTILAKEISTKVRPSDHRLKYIV